ncbi:MAG: 3-dehydroquinate synthase [Bacteroidetes bacterium]|nr:MAG: 3-dehydroquinate synthase [Bacteroidota bacterium]
MQTKTYHFSTASTDVYINGSLSQLSKIVDKKQTIIITDTHVFEAHGSKLKGWRTIVMPAGEAHKNQQTADDIIGQLIQLEADRQTILVGLGGGVVTDMTGYVASIYMRGIAFGFVPTTVLAMVDAAIGGKNGVDVGLYKNMVGTIRQPNFLLYDVALLKTLPHPEWTYGFAEIIKHASIKSLPMFKQLQQHQLDQFKSKKLLLQQLIERNVLLKIKVVQQDEFEKADRKLLNFGHTLGHAFENQYQLPHGQAIAIGMVHAAHFSGQLADFRQTAALVALLEQYELPTHLRFETDTVFEVLKMDKKRAGAAMNFVLLKKIGSAFIQPIALTDLKTLMQNP